MKFLTKVGLFSPILTLFVNTSASNSFACDIILRKTFSERFQNYHHWSQLETGAGI